MPIAENKVRVTLAVEKKLRDEITARAKANGRSVGEEIIGGYLQSHSIIERLDKMEQLLVQDHDNIMEVMDTVKANQEVFKEVINRSNTIDKLIEKL
jgi:hypothetical protein